MIRDRLLVTTILLWVAGCSGPNARVVTMQNQAAALRGDIGINPLIWRVITSTVNAHDSTMSTLYGNERAVRHARAGAERNYPAGSVLALVTWRQQEDRRWFGAAVPAEPRTVEVVEVGVSANGGIASSYRSYEGSPLKERATAESLASDRIQYLLSQRAAVMP